jgi:putative methionine-R-sulfoxide reductase with GAF domain
MRRARRKRRHVSFAVTPIANEGQVVGEIDIDSDRPAAFGEDDRAFLEQVAAVISAHCQVGRDTRGVPWSDVN